MQSTMLHRRRVQHPERGTVETDGEAARGLVRNWSPETLQFGVGSSGIDACVYGLELLLDNSESGSEVISWAKPQFRK